MSHRKDVLNAEYDQRGIPLCLLQSRGRRAADYIPELAKADTKRLAISITDLAGRTHSVGDSQVRFTMQSISKVVLLATALRFAGFGGVFARVGVEPTGDPFNSIIRLETDSSNRPSNPMINAGAIAVTTAFPARLPGNGSSMFWNTLAPCSTTLSWITTKRSTAPKAKPVTATVRWLT